MFAVRCESLKRRPSMTGEIGAEEARLLEDFGRRMRECQCLATRPIAPFVAHGQEPRIRFSKLVPVGCFGLERWVFGVC